MIIATSLSTYLDECRGDLDKSLSLIKEDGFDACGIVIEEPIDYYISISQKLKDSDLKFCIHANMTDTNIASINEGIRKESVKQIKDAILLGKEINAIVNFHPGSFRNQFMVDEAYAKVQVLGLRADGIGKVKCAGNFSARGVDIQENGVNLVHRHRSLEIGADVLV